MPAFGRGAHFVDVSVSAELLNGTELDAESAVELGQFMRVDVRSASQLSIRVGGCAPVALLADSDAAGSLCAFTCACARARVCLGV